MNIGSKNYRCQKFIIKTVFYDSAYQKYPFLGLEK